MQGSPLLQVREKLVVYGGVLDPHACFLLQRGMATLALRVRQQIASTHALALFLEEHPQVRPVLAQEQALRPVAGRQGSWLLACAYIYMASQADVILFI